MEGQREKENEGASKIWAEELDADAPSPACEDEYCQSSDTTLSDRTKR